MSPEISMECRAHPSQEDSVSGLVGTTSATGRPNRVTRTGAPVRRTSSRTAKHVALNLEIAISRMFNLYHSPRPWSECQVLNLFGGAGQKYAANPGLTPSFRRSLPETGCLSQGLPHGICCPFVVFPKRVSTQSPRNAGIPATPGHPAA